MSSISVISYHPAIKDKIIAKGWEVATVGNAQDWLNVITAYSWSPIIFKEGYRDKNHFLGSEFAALDVDEEVTIKNMCENLDEQGFGYLIGTTKSHQIWKNTAPPCDRFRVILQFDRPIEDVKTYEYNVKSLIKMFNTDTNCSDAARGLFPCTKIVENRPGKKVPVFPFIAPAPKYQLRKESRYKDFKKMPTWLTNFLELGTFKNKNNSRDLQCFQVAKDLRTFGYPKETVFDLINNSPFSREDFPESQLRKCVESAFK